MAITLKNKIVNKSYNINHIFDYKFIIQKKRNYNQHFEIQISEHNMNNEEISISTMKRKI